MGDMADMVDMGVMADMGDMGVMDTTHTVMDIIPTHMAMEGTIHFGGGIKVFITEQK